MTHYKTIICLLMCFLLIGCGTAGDRERDILTIRCQAPITEIEGIIDNGLLGIVSATVTITWIYLYNGEISVNIDVEEIYDNKTDAEKAWEVRRKEANVKSLNLNDSTCRYENINQIDESYSQLRKLVENLDGWEIVSE